MRRGNGEQPAPTADAGIVVLGGGLAGLAAAYRTGAPVLEALPVVGGTSRSETVDGYTFDYGIHILQPHDQAVTDLLETLNVRLLRHRRRGYIYSHQRYTAYPFQVNIAGLPMAIRANCVWGFLTRRRGREPRNYLEWIYHNLGRGFGDTFLIPYSRKFWTVSPSEMTFDWTGGRVPQPSAWQVVAGAIRDRSTSLGTHAQFEYPAGHQGYGAIAEALAGRLERVHLEHRATRIDPANNTVTFDGGHTVSYRRLISTIPLPELIKLIPDVPTDVRAAVAALRHNSIFVINLGVHRANLTEKHWVHFPEPDISFFRISFPANLARDVVPRGHAAITAEVAYSDWQPIDRQRITQQVIADLQRVGVLRRDDVVEVKSTMDIPYGYVIYDHQRPNHVRTIHEWLISQRIHPTGRYGKWEYLWSHDALLVGMQTADEVLTQSGGELGAAAKKEMP